MLIPDILKQHVKLYFSKNIDKNLNAIRIIKLLKNNNLLEKLIITFLLQENNKEIYLGKVNIVNFILNNKEYKYCKTCGKLLNIKQKMFCSSKCSLSSKNNPFNRAKDKIQLTNLKKYGHINPFGSKQIQLKIIKTNLEKYGVLNPFLSNIIKEKIKNINILRYGVNVPIQNELIKNKILKSLLLKYGVKNPLQSNLIKNNIKKHNIEKFGYLSHSQLKILSLDNVIPSFNVNDFIDKSKLYKWKCKFCGREFYARYYNGIVKKKCICQKLSGYSTLEILLYLFCKLYFKNILKNNRSLIKPYELDIVIPLRKLAILFNGCWYHSILHMKITGYQLMKTLMCLKLGYRLIHIWLDLWLNNKKLIKNKLIEVFENRLLIDYTGILNRDWYLKKDILGYKLLIISPIVILRKNFHCENTGYLKYIKND